MLWNRGLAASVFVSAMSGRSSAVWIAVVGAVEFVSVVQFGLSSTGVYQLVWLDVSFDLVVVDVAEFGVYLFVGFSCRGQLEVEC